MSLSFPKRIVAAMQPPDVPIGPPPLPPDLQATALEVWGPAIGLLIAGVIVIGYFLWVLKDRGPPKK